MSRTFGDSSVGVSPVLIPMPLSAIILTMNETNLPITEIDADTIAEIEAQYPREFSVNGAKFDVEYDPVQKLVTLRWQRGIRQPTLSSVLLPRWNNWKVQLDLRAQVRTGRP